MKDSSAWASETPDLADLQRQFATCSPLSGGWNRLTDNDRVRYNIWEGQSPDGKKWDKLQPNGKPAMPFDGSNDARIPLADDIINDIVDVLTEGWHRSMARVVGNPEAERTGRAAYVRNLMSWIRGTKLYGELGSEIELLGQNGCTYGASFLQVDWERQLGYQYHTVTLEDLMYAGQQNPEFNLFLQMLADPAMDEDALPIIQALYMSYVEARKPSNYEWEPKPLSDKRARHVIGELREEGRAKIPLPYVCKNQPTVKCRKLWEDIFITETTSAIQNSQSIFTLDWYTEAELRAIAEAEDWDEDWVNAAVELKGQFAQYTTPSINNGNWMSSALEYLQSDDQNLIEVTTCWTKQVDEDGVLGVYKTVYHGLITHLPGIKGYAYAWHGLADQPLGANYPFVQWRWEMNTRSLCGSRGVPQIVATHQSAIKAQLDALTDRTSFETLPPIITPRSLGVDYRLGPAVKLPVNRMDQKPEFMSPPASAPNTSMLVLDRVQMWMDNYYGRRRSDSAPEDSLIKRQKRVRSFLMACSEAMAMVFKMCAAYMPPEQIEKITGVPGGSLGSIEDITDDLVYQLSFDVQELSPDFVELKNKALVEIAAMDSSGTIDKGKLVKYVLRALDPAVEAEIVTDVGTATNALLDKVKSDFANMYLGIPATPVENDPTAAKQMEFAMQLIQVSQAYKDGLAQNTNGFRDLVENWMQNRQQSVMQQQNKQIGRAGVDMGQVEE